MALNVVVYGKEGDGAAFAALGTLRSILGELRVEANIQIVTDPLQVTSAGVDRTPPRAADEARPAGAGAAQQHAVAVLPAVE
jgi:hypothetical protein